MGPIRQRKALSCVDCRRRKVKCDRTLPVCIRCQKGGNADKCVYVPHTGPTEGSLLTPEEDSPAHSRGTNPEDFDALVAPWRREDGFVPARQASVPHAAPAPAKVEGKIEKEILKSILPRVIELETYVRSAGARPVSAEMWFGIGNPTGPGYDDAERNPMSDHDKVLLRGKSFKTQYFGPSFPISMLMQFDDLSRFVKEILSTIPALTAAKKSMSAVRAASKELYNEPVPHDLESLRRMVPARDVADQLVQHYLRTFETTYRILHVPSFMKEYEDYWQAPHDARPEFIVQFLLVAATVYCVVPVGPFGFVGRSSAAREVLSRWITAAEAWVNEQSKKHTTMSHVQIQILVFVAKSMNCIKLKREWTSSGNLVRTAMAAGMHREPSLLSTKINQFDCEMRRRLWFTIVEIDLQRTLFRGMAPTVDSMEWDCLPPRNVHDEDFDESSESLPPSRPRTEFTRTSFLHVSNEHLGLRIEITRRVNSIRLSIDLETVMQFDNKLRKILDGLPTYSADQPEHEFSRTVARLGLYEYIMTLHIPFASQTSQQSRFLYSIASRRDATLKTLKMYRSLPGIMQLHLSDMREDTCRAVLCMCHDMITNRDDDDDDALPVPAATLPLMAMIIDILARRVGTLGQGFHSFWTVISAYALVRWKLSDQPAQLFAKEAADQVVDLFHQTILSQQVPMPNLDGTPVELHAVPTHQSAESNEVLESIFADLDQQLDPMIDLMNFDFSRVWNLDALT